MDEQVRSHLSVEEAMKIAINEAYKGAPFVSPNPLVGCVVLDSDGCFLKSGYHEIYGGPHAEVNALKGLSKEQLKGAHVIVTLEPCAHEGKTPSCAKSLAQLPIRKVTYGLIDPNPLVAGQGVAILKKAGIQVEEFPDFKEELEEVCEAFLLNQRQKKIFVALKVATSLDGQMALRTGESKWITGEEAREHSHYLRSCYDGILVGAGTVKHDNPSLNIRHPKISKANKVIVFDPQGELLKNYSELNLAKSHHPSEVFWCVAEDQKIELKAGQPVLLKVSTKNGSFDLDQLMTKLWDKGLRSVFVEGGSETFAHFLRAHWAHRLYLFVAPHLIGAGGGLSWTQGLKIQEMKDRQELRQFKTQNFGQDLLITAKFKT